MNQKTTHLELNYSDKWIEFGFLDEETIKNQLEKFNSGIDDNLEHYRYASFLSWLEKKERLTNREIQNYIELAIEDSHKSMAGSAVKHLFESKKLEEHQYEYVKKRFSEFGEWTKKLISRQDLKKEIEHNSISRDLIEMYLVHNQKFKDNELIDLLLEKLEDVELAKVFERFNFPKKTKKKIEIRIKELS